MKRSKFLAAILSFIMVFSFLISSVACGKEEPKPNPNPDDKPKIEAPVIEKDRYEYDWALGGTLEIVVDLKSQTIKSVKLQQTVLNADDYTASNNKIAFGEEFCSGLNEGENELTIETAGGQDKTVIYAYNSTPALDNDLLKLQGNNESDVVFELDTKGKNIKTVKLDEKQLEESAYSYDAQAKNFVVKKEYLNTLPVGIYTMNIQIDNLQQSNVNYYIGTYGNEIAHQTNTVMDMSKLNNFENYSVGSEVELPNTLTPVAKPIVIDGEQAIDGKSLSFKVSGINTFFSTQNDSNSPYKKGVVYCFKMKIRTTKQSGLVFKWSYDDNFWWINEDKSFNETNCKDKRSQVSYSEENNYWDIEIYYSYNGNSKEDKFEILTFNAAEGNEVIMDDLMILETSLPITAKAPAIESQIYNNQDLSIKEFMPQGYRFISIFNGDSELKMNEDYSISGNELTLKNSYMQGKTLPLQLTVKSSAYKNYEGDEETFTSDLKINEGGKPGYLNSAIINYQTSEGSQGVELPFALNGYEIASVSHEDTLIDQKFYTYADNSLLIKKEYLDTLNAGIHLFKLLTTDSEKSFNFYVNLNMVVGESIIDIGFENPDDDWDWHKANFEIADNTNFGSLKAGKLSGVTDGVGYGLSTLDALSLNAEKMYQIKFKIQLDSEAQFLVALNAKDGTEKNDNVIWYNNGGNKQWDSFGRPQTVVDLGNGIFEICAYHKGEGSKLEIMFTGTHFIDDISLIEVTGIDY